MVHGKWGLFFIFVNICEVVLTSEMLSWSVPPVQLYDVSVVKTLFPHKVMNATTAPFHYFE